MEKAGKAICLADTGGEVQPHISSKQHQAREVCVWIPKHRPGEPRISETLPHDGMMNNAKSVSLLRDTRSASLLQNARLMKSASLKCRQINATIINKRSTSLISRGTRPASQSQNARAVSVLQNMNSCLQTLHPRDLHLRVAMQD